MMARTDPSSGSITKQVLGPNIAEGHSLQVSVPGGTWKCGRVLGGAGSDHFTLMGEAVAPGFDYHDFEFISEGMVGQLAGVSEQAKEELLSHVGPSDRASMGQELAESIEAAAAAGLK